MTGRISLKLLSVGLLLGAAGCASFYEIPIETPIAAKLDVSAFQRVFIAGFLSSGTEDVDGNVETVRLLRSQLRMKSSLKVVDADALPLLDVAAATGAQGQAAGPGASETKETPKLSSLKNEKDLEPFEHIFADADYWKKIGEEYQNPLIVTGTVVFTPHSQAGMVQREVEVQDALGRAYVIENPSIYVSLATSTMTEIEFLHALVDMTGCRLLCDVSNVYLSGHNMGYDPYAFIDRFPAAAVAERIQPGMLGTRRETTGGR